MNTKRKINLDREAGLTFLEIMIVLIILGLVMATVGKKLLGAGDKAKVDLTKVSLQQVKQDIEQFQLRYNTLPSSLEDLTRCTQATGQGCVPIANQDSLVDAWGNTFVYQRAGSSRAYVIKSLGADGRDGGDGVNYDITVEGP